jgi:hypothetical protein
VDDEPDWMTDEMGRDWEQAVADIDEVAPPSILATILIEWLRPGYAPPTQRVSGVRTVGWASVQG